VNKASRSRLHPGCAASFPSDNLHDRVARAVCEARCLARRELFESWSFAQKIRRFIDAPVVWDLGAGHGLVAMLLAIMEPDLTLVRAVDRRKPVSFEKIRDALAASFGDRIAKVRFDEVKIESLAPPEERIFITAVHACGKRTDDAIDIALNARASLALLPCCHDASIYPLPGALTGRWSKREAVDLARIFRLDSWGYKTHARKIDDGLTSCADVIIGVAP